jgi:DHA3 family macrolide efflux protein-like MFS transporter
VEFALAWYLTIKTGSATVLATSMMAALVPYIVVGPLIGPFIDRWNRKRIIILADLSISLITVGLVVLFLTGTIQIWHIYLAMVARAIGQSFHFPAMQASIPLIVSEKHLSRAAGLNQMLQGMINIAAPPAGALLLGIFPMQWVLAIDVITAIIAVGCILPIVIPQPERSFNQTRTSFLTEMMQGFRYVWTWRGLSILIIISALITFFLIPTFTLLPIMVTKYLGGEVLRLGWLESAFGVGVIAGGLVLGVWGGFKRKVVTSLAGVMVAGIATVGLGMTSLSLFMLGVCSCFLVGFGLSFANGPIMAALQSIVAKDMQGRIFSLLGSISSAMSPLGLAFAGPLADAIGIRSIYYIAGIATLIIGVAAVFIPSLMNLEKSKSGES